ncbi:hypothetical protein [Oleiharenicola sp. Vm1]|uniref:hypothetical protein n=1 Tax=Oleiharenicola sp. Vm1 TaxID=3398393 RepID=UPI0039F599FC
MFTQETLLARGFRSRDEALAVLVASLPRWKHVRGTVRPDGCDLLCSAPSGGRFAPFRYAAQVRLRTEGDSSISVLLRLERVTKRKLVWLLLSFLFFPLLCVYPDAHHLGLGIGLGVMSGFARAAFLLLGAERVESQFERLYGSPSFRVQATSGNTNAA